MTISASERDGMLILAVLAALFLKAVLVVPRAVPAHPFSKPEISNKMTSNFHQDGNLRLMFELVRSISNTIPVFQRVNNHDIVVFRKLPALTQTGSV